MAAEKRVLVVYRDTATWSPVGEVLGQRRDAVEWRLVPTLDEARRAVKSQRWDAVLVAPDQKQLSLKSFVRFVRTRHDPPRLLLIDAQEEGATTVFSGSPGRLVDQLFAIIEVPRSQIWDFEIVEQLGFCGWVEFSRVRAAKSDAVMLLVKPASPEIDAETIGPAQRASLLRGAGLAQTIEVFWDDPQPHILQMLPPGVSLDRLVRQRAKWGLELSLSVARGLADGIATLHEAGYSAGRLGPAGVWLTEAGDVLALGHGPMQLGVGPRAHYFGLPSDAPPEEYGTSMPTQIPGDAFRMGILLMKLAVDDVPFRNFTPTFYLQREWRPDLDRHQQELRPAMELLEILLQPQSVDRPRGALLLSVLESVAPRHRRQLIADAVKWAQAAPVPRW